MEPATKSVSISFRVWPLVEDCLEAAAECEQQSQTNMLEKLVPDDYRRTFSLASLAEEPRCNNVPREEKNGHTVTKG